MDYSFKNIGKNLSPVKKRLVELEKTIKQTENNIKLQKLFKDNCKRKIELLRQTLKKKNFNKCSEKGRTLGYYWFNHQNCFI